MVESVKIINNGNIPINYILEIDNDNFSNGKEYNFKPGVNIIIGKNGSGKSTLIEILNTYLLCEKGESKISDYNYEINKLFSLNDDLYDGIEVKSDYYYKAYNFVSHKDVKSDDAMSNFRAFGNYFNNIHSSTGEQNINTLFELFDYAFNDNNCKFPINDNPTKLGMNKKTLKLLRYYETNKIDYKKYNEITFLLDEPDRNLDIDYIEQLYNILSFHKKHTQLICVIHNPILIYKLSKLDNINFIEMSNGYLDEIKELFKNL